MNATCAARCRLDDVNRPIKQCCFDAKALAGVVSGPRTGDLVRGDYSCDAAAFVRWL